jgi:ribosomal protein S2
LNEPDYKFPFGCILVDCNRNDTHAGFIAPGNDNLFDSADLYNFLLNQSIQRMDPDYESEEERPLVPEKIE